MSRRREKLLNENVCSECGSSTLIHDKESGEVICGSCGLVITESVINKGPEWRAFTQSEKESRSRVGVPLSFAVHDKGLTTMIGRVGRDAFGRKIPLNTKLQMLRLRKWQIRSRVHSSVDRNRSPYATATRASRKPLIWRYSLLLSTYIPLQPFWRWIN